MERTLQVFFLGFSKVKIPTLLEGDMERTRKDVLGFPLNTVKGQNLNADDHDLTRVQNQK